MNARHTLSPLLAALAAALALGACGRNDDGTAGRQDAAASRSEQTQADTTVRSSAGAAADQVAKAVDDASITSTITAELARDGALDPSRIDVDTSMGRVVLRGSAPDADAKERAKRIAQGVEGVKAVDNYLSVNGQS
ncbi:MAG TPA: BON domain-containing protein [Albitalea sp.]